MSPDMDMENPEEKEDEPKLSATMNEFHDKKDIEKEFKK